VAQSFSLIIQRLGSALGLTNRDLGLIFSSNLVGSFGDGLYASSKASPFILAIAATSILALVASTRKLE
jgi:hypothetical protein